jgi:hypothetical protein
MQRLCTSTLWASLGVSKRIIPQPSGAGMGKLSGFYSNVTASLRYFYDPFMTSLLPVCHTPQRQGGVA